MSHPAENLAAAMASPALTRVEGIPFPRVGSGKVRELFDLGDALLLIATDRISAFDVILEPGIPAKGAILTGLSRHWFRETADLVPNHVLPDQEERLQALFPDRPDLQLRGMVVRKLRPLAVECVVRGYLAGSGWASYRKSGSVCGHVLPAGLRQADRLSEPLFTPTTKASEGHDLPITEEACARELGQELFDAVRTASLRLYERGHDRAGRAGMILADTKFEFGTDGTGKLFLIDEVLTPDSSRYWPADRYSPGISPPSFDKQYVRDFLDRSDWNKQPPAPVLPEEVVRGTQERYFEAYRKLLG